MTIFERALEMVTDHSRIGLGSGRAARAFVKVLGDRVRHGALHVNGVPTSEETADLATQEDIPLLPLAQAGILDLTVDGADEVAPNLDLIKGYGRALVREKVIAASSRRLVILVGDERSSSRGWERGASCRSRWCRSPCPCASEGYVNSAAGPSPTFVGMACS
jgi:ribose 5-phosphate isomerase A